MKKALVALAAAALALALASCTSANTEYTEYAPDGKTVLKHYVKQETGFTQGWSNGPGKTVDLHPEVNGLSF